MFFKDSFHLSEWQSYRWRKIGGEKGGKDRHRDPICWVSSHRATTTRTGPTGSLFQVPCVGTETQTLGLIPLLPRFFSRELEVEQRTTQSSQMGYQREEQLIYPPHHNANLDILPPSFLSSFFPLSFPPILSSFSPPLFQKLFCLGKTVPIIYLITP